jgi:hydroxymethylpyrimidine pyrophosphatase-like HAD family hydrolase
VTGKFQLVAFDLDGTLVGRDNVVTARVLEAVTKMHDAGIRGCLCTGRMYRACIAYARELHFEAPVIPRPTKSYRIYRCRTTWFAI